MKNMCFTLDLGAIFCMILALVASDPALLNELWRHERAELLALNACFTW